VNCFHKAHFIPSPADQDVGYDVDDIEDIPSADEWNMIAGDTLTFVWFVQADEDLIARETRTIAARC